jgi:hypothetical protein
LIGEVAFTARSKAEDIVRDIVKSFRVSKGCLVRAMYQQEKLGAMDREIRAYIAATEKAETKRDDFVLWSAGMTTTLLTKSETYALTMAGNQIWRRVAERFLISTPSKSWVR